MNLPWKRPSVLTGRELNPEFALITGEAAGQRLTHPEPLKGTHPVPVWQEVPSQQGAHRDYYRLPLLKEPVWIWTVPAYFYVGGIAGGSAVLASLLHGKKSMASLASACRWLAFLGSSLGSMLLTADLGKPLRFLNMLRVFRPTSPMSVGSWSLAWTGALSTLTIVQGDGKWARATSYGVAGGGLMLAGYTGVLLGNSANPLWQGTRRSLPVLFTASAMASTSGILEMLPLNRREELVVQRFGTMGKVAEAGAMLAMEGEAAANPEAAKGLKEGRAGFLWNSAKLLVAAGVVLGFVPVKSPWKRRLGGAVTTAGAICLRFALLESGKHVAREPQAVIQGQRP